MQSDRAPRLSVEVKLMDEPCLWRWQIRDRDRDEVVDSSWVREWMAYESPDEAYRAGRQRLTTLTGRGFRGRRRPGRGAGGPASC